ncbi:MAG: sulfotransferase domain-containing protein [Gammaproteobacteria bacterium]|nr:sulfotransferase domain-containing protein [Gammaproteobacteria bacterium]
MSQPDFIGIGAQKSGTSWIYACLHVHPQVCIPRKEIHFFSRERNWSKGYDWYAGNFDGCHAGQVIGEFSTSYLADEYTPARIHNKFPDVKLVVSLRNPIDRAYSNYINDIKTGIVSSSTDFLDALDSHPEYMNQGQYARQVNRYLDYFKPAQLLILIYEDSLIDPGDYIKKIYRFLNIDHEFIPEFIRTKINPARIPRHVWIDSGIRAVSSYLRSNGFRTLFWQIKKSGLAERIRTLNTRMDIRRADVIDTQTRHYLYEKYDIQSEISAISKIIGRDLIEWRIQT